MSREVGYQEVIETQVSDSTTADCPATRFEGLGMTGVSHYNRKEYSSKGESKSFNTIPLVLPGEFSVLQDCEAIYQTSFGITRLAMDRSAIAKLSPSGPATEANVERFSQDEIL
jgi:hypothetical protein